MWVLDLLHHADILELDVQVLVDRLQHSADLDVVLELDGDLVVHQGLEEAGGATSSACTRLSRAIARAMRGSCERHLDCRDGPEEQHLAGLCGCCELVMLISDEVRSCLRGGMI